jgi:hypothetical protein
MKGKNGDRGSGEEEKDKINKERNKRDRRNIVRKQ